MARRRSVVRRAGAGRRVPAGVLLSVVLVIGAIALIIGRAGQAPGSSSVMQAGDDTAAVAGRVATGPARSSQNFFERLGTMWNADDRIVELERENRELQQWRELAERLAERNARYEELLRMPADTFGEGADVEHSIAAQLVLDSGGPFMRTLVANAGEAHGVHIGFIAVNENGLIGRVVSVGQHSSRVLMLDDYNSRIPVMGEASRVRAVLAGQATRPPELVTHPYQLQAPRLDFIVGAQALREGERVITSGDGGLFPRGIPVGVAHRQSDGSWRVELAASQRPIDFVRIIPYAGVARPEAAPATESAPPLNSVSSVAVITRETMAPPPSAPSAAPLASAPAQAAPPRPRPPQQQANNTPPAQTPSPQPAAPAEQPATPQE